MKITCKCGKRIRLARVFNLKTHAHCKKCKLEWHHWAGKVYCHPYTKFKKRLSAKENPNIKAEFNWYQFYLKNIKKGT